MSEQVDEQTQVTEPPAALVKDIPNLPERLRREFHKIRVYFQKSLWVIYVCMFLVAVISAAVAVHFLDIKKVHDVVAWCGLHVIFFAYLSDLILLALRPPKDGERMEIGLLGLIIVSWFVPFLLTSVPYLKQIGDFDKEISIIGYCIVARELLFASIIVLLPLELFALFVGIGHPSLKRVSNASVSDIINSEKSSFISMKRKNSALVVASALDLATLVFLDFVANRGFFVHETIGAQPVSQQVSTSVGVGGILDSAGASTSNANAYSSAISCGLAQVILVYLLLVWFVSFASSFQAIYWSQYRDDDLESQNAG